MLLYKKLLLMTFGTTHVHHENLFAGRKNHSNTHKNIVCLTCTLQFQHVYSRSSGRTARLQLWRQERNGPYVSYALQFLWQWRGNDRQLKPHILRNPAALRQKQLYSTVHIHWNLRDEEVGKDERKLRRRVWGHYLFFWHEMSAKNTSPKYVGRSSCKVS